MPAAGCGSGSSSPASASGPDAARAERTKPPRRAIACRLVAHFVPHTDAEIEAMLGFLGLSRLEELFDHIPTAVRLAQGLDLPDGRSEADVIDDLSALAGRNHPTGRGGSLVCFA